MASGHPTLTLQPFAFSMITFSTTSQCLDEISTAVIRSEISKPYPNVASKPDSNLADIQISLICPHSPVFTKCSSCTKCTIFYTLTLLLYYFNLQEKTFKIEVAVWRIMNTFHIRSKKMLGYLWQRCLQPKHMTFFSDFFFWTSVVSAY